MIASVGEWLNSSGTLSAGESPWLCRRSRRLLLTWQIPPPNGRPTPHYRSPTVRVLFGGAPAISVAVVSATRLFARVPRTPLPMTRAAGWAEGNVDVVVQNLDDDETPIVGEQATLAAGYRYRRVQLAVESDLSRLNRALIQDWNTQVLANTSITTHTDFDPDTGDTLNTTPIAELPAITLIGPQLITNRFYSENVEAIDELAGNERAIRKSAERDDVAYQIVGVAKLFSEASNLMAVVRTYFRDNHYLRLNRVKDDPSKGFVQFEMHLDRTGNLAMQSTSTNPDSSDIHFFTGRFVIKGFDPEALAGFVDQQVVERIAQVTQDPEILSVPMTPEE